MHTAVMLAMRNNPEVQSNELNRVSQKLALAIAYHQYDPIFSLTGQVSQTQSRASGAAPVQATTAALTPQVTLNTPMGTQFTVSMSNAIDDYYNPGVTASVTQPLLQGFGPDVVLNNLYTAIDTEQINKLTFRDTVVNTIVQIVQDYTDLLAAIRNLKAQEIELKNQEQQVKDIEKKIKAGTASRNDRVTAESQLASQRLNIVTNENVIEQARLTLLQDLGLPPDTQFEIEQKIKIPKDKLPSVPESIEMALNWSTQYQQLLLQKKQAERNLLVAEDAKRWQLDLTASATTGQGSGGGPNAGLNSVVNGQNYSNAVTLNLTVPLDYLPLKQAIVDAKVTLRNTKIQIANQNRVIATQVINVYRNIQVQKEQIRLSEKDAALKQQVLNNDIKKYNYGRISLNEVNIDRQNLINAQLTVIANQATYLNLLESFYSIIGCTLKRWELRLQY